MRLPVILFLSSLILLAIAILFDVNYINYKSPIPYSDWEKINFYDFKGLKKPGLKLDGIAEFAYIKTNREIRWVENGNIAVTTYFHPSRSYVFEQNIRNADLLRHEIYHFHIAEYCSRLLRKEIFDEVRPATRSMLGRLKRKYDRLEAEMQERYDEDSYHSYILQEQKKWESKVDDLLLSLEDFSDPVVRSKN